MTNEYFSFFFTKLDFGNYYVDDDNDDDDLSMKTMSTTTTSSPSSLSSSSSSPSSISSSPCNYFVDEHHQKTAAIKSYLAEGIENILRMAKETRLVHCTEILIPHNLIKKIASKVMNIAECEPCGLRGCLLMIFLENDNVNCCRPNIPNQQPNQLNYMKKFDEINSPNKKLLGEIDVDSDIVPTFEVFLTLKRVQPSWLDSLEYRFLRKRPIILSEIYLLNKNKLYQSSSK